MGVVLSPALAKEVARTLRIQLACELAQPFDEPLPSREEVARLRTVVDRYVDQLETIAWGEPSGAVRISGPPPLLEAIARELRDGGNVQLADPLYANAPQAQSVRRQGRRMIRAAEAIDEALVSESKYQLAW